MVAVSIKKLTKKFGNFTAVDSLDLEIAGGEIFGLLGVNGAGKTTTVKMLSCLISPTSGDATIDDLSVTSEPSEVKRLIGVAPQETAIAQNLTVYENLELICGLYGIKSDEKKTRIDRISEQFDLKEISSKKAGKLSGGMKRRLSLAMAMIADPKILFLDEPTLGLDVLARAELWDMIRSLRGRVTVILTTHYMDEAEELSDRIGIMKGGKLLALGTASELMKKYGAEKFEQAFISIVKETGK